MHRNVVMFEDVVFEICEQTDIQTDKRWRLADCSTCTSHPCKSQSRNWINKHSIELLVNTAVWMCMHIQVLRVLRAICHLKCYVKTHMANQWMSGHVVSYSHWHHLHYEHNVHEFFFASVIVFNCFLIFLVILINLHWNVSICN